MMYCIKNKLLFASAMIIMAFSFLGSCQREDPAIIDEGGLTSSWVTDSLTGTTWVLYQYRDDMSTTPISRSDTLIFTSVTNYTWNGVNATYELYNCGEPSVCGYGYRFTLNGTPFGNVVGIVPQNFNVYGEINDEPFDEINMGGNNQTFYFWMVKL